jgi:hypothetical protein
LSLANSKIIISQISDNNLCIHKVGIKEFAMPKGKPFGLINSKLLTNGFARWHAKIEFFDFMDT